tara:strand:+ start:40546 stop:41277 length:732 start_codon:yes stop_codon:yes gene_type:complete
MDKKIRLLIVEDDEDVRRAMTLFLGREFDVSAAEDSISGLSAARRDQPDVIILDLGLPGGDGLQYLERLQELPDLANTPTIVFTGRDGTGVEVDAMSRGADCVFRKPTDLHDLAAAVRELAGRTVASAKRVLIVDDDTDLTHSLALRMRSEGYAVSTSVDGTGALMSVRDCPPDVVLLDLGLPGGDGFSLLERLRGMGTYPVIVLSGQDAADCRDRALAAGATGYVEKPHVHTQLMELVRSSL